MKLSLFVAVTSALPVALLAQSDPATRAAATITEADVKRRIYVVADDSMGGRDTPSRGLDLTAQWVAGEFKRFGLKPAAPSGSFLLPYLITTRQLLPEQTSLTFTGPGAAISLLAKDATVAQVGASGEFPVVLLGGGIDSVATAQFKDKAVVWVADWGAGFPSNIDAVIGAAFSGGAKLIVAVVNNPGAFAQFAARPRGVQTMVGGGPSEGAAIFLANEAAVVAQVPEAAGQFAQIRAATTPTVVPVPDWMAKSVIRDTILSRTEAPNVAAVAEGTDPVLKNEYIVVSAHMDHVGSECKGSGAKDRICNGADDDGSGTVGIVELAEAFAEAGARTKRSIIFLGVSGEEKGLWGSARFAKAPPVPIGSIVANLNIDMIGRNWKDTWWPSECSIPISAPRSPRSPGNIPTFRWRPSTTDGPRKTSTSGPTTTTSPSRASRSCSSPAAFTKTTTPCPTRPTRSTRRRKRGSSS